MQRDHDATCPVCFDPKDDMAPLDPCRHRMCPPCFENWRAAKLPEAPTCPVCRTTVAGLLDPAIEDRVDLQLSRFRKWRDDAGLVDQPHQEHGVRWALRHEARSDGVCGARSGGLICDEMGLGKTIIAVALIVSNFCARTLILLPPALITQWVDVFKRICHHEPLVFHGRAKRTIDADTLAKAPIVIASYYTTATKNKLATPLHRLHWGRLIMDEAHHVRNRKTLYDGVIALQTDLTWMLTGTPLQNAETDLTAYWHILGVTHDITSTMYAQDRHRLRAIIASRILRRTKDSIGMDIPPVVHETVIVPWTMTTNHTSPLNSTLRCRSQAYISTTSLHALASSLAPSSPLSSAVDKLVSCHPPSTHTSDSMLTLLAQVPPPHQPPHPSYALFSRTFSLPLTPVANSYSATTHSKSTSSLPALDTLVSPHTLSMDALTLHTDTLSSHSLQTSLSCRFAPPLKASTSRHSHTSTSSLLTGTPHLNDKPSHALTDSDNFALFTQLASSWITSSHTTPLLTLTQLTLRLSKSLSLTHSNSRLSRHTNTLAPFSWLNNAGG